MLLPLASFRDAPMWAHNPFILTSFMLDSILTGFDVDGRPIIYMRPGRENTETSPRQLRHLVYVLYVPHTLPMTSRHNILTNTIENAQRT